MPVFVGGVERSAAVDAAAILVDTAELQTDWTDGGRLDLILDLINAIATDWTNAGRLDLILDAILAAIDTEVASILAAVDSEVAAILADTGTDGVVLGTKAAAFRTLVGEMQVAKTTIDLAQNAGAYTLFTGTTDDFILEFIIIRLPAVDVSDDTNITSIKIHTDDATEILLINTTAGAKANLTSEAQLAWTGAAYINTGSIIQLTIAGGAADAATVCEVVAVGRAVGNGGNLA